MSLRTQYLSKLIGLSLIFFALVGLVNKPLLTQALDGLVRDPAKVLLWGLLLVFSGLAFVLGHNRWKGNALTVVVTAIGWLTLFKGFLLLYVPTAVASTYPGFAGGFSYAYILAALVVGGWLTYEGWKSSSEAGNGAVSAP